jgi:hypothetical protein
MLHTLARVMTGLELGLAALTLFIGAGFTALVNVGTEGAMRPPILAFIALTTLVLLGWNGLTVYRRYRRLRSGRCGHPFCHGYLASSPDIPAHLLICDHCRRVWPKLAEPQPQPAAAG